MIPLVQCNNENEDKECPQTSCGDRRKPLGTRYVDETNLDYISLFFPVFLVESAVLNNYIIVFISYLILYI